MDDGYDEPFFEYNVGTFTIIDGSYGETCFFLTFNNNTRSELSGHFINSNYTSLPKQYNHSGVKNIGFPSNLLYIYVSKLNNNIQLQFIFQTF